LSGFRHDDDRFVGHRFRHDHDRFFGHPLCSVAPACMTRTISQPTMLYRRGPAGVSSLGYHGPVDGVVVRKRKRPSAGFSPLIGYRLPARSIPPR
jgi:hypothetical protein